MAMCCRWLGAAAAAPQDPGVAVTEIQAALERGDVAAAKARVDAALLAHPNDPALNNFAGVIAAQNGEWQSAESHFREAIRLAPRAIPPYENLGRLYQEQGALDPAALTMALDVYRALLVVDPANTEGLFQ